MADGLGIDRHHFIIVVLDQCGYFFVIAVEGADLVALFIGIEGAEIVIMNKACIKLFTVVADYADILGIFAGRGNKGAVYKVRFAVVIEHGVAVAVDPKVDIGDFGENIGGAIGNTGIVIAKVSKADDDVAAFCVQLIALCLSDLGKPVLVEAEADNVVGVGLGDGLGSSHTEDTDLIVFGLDDDIIVKYEAAVLFIGDVGSKDGEVHQLGQLEKMLIAIVEIMVAGSHCAVTDCVHGVDSGLAPRSGYDGKSVKGVACVENDDLCAGTLIFVCKIPDCGHTHAGAVLLDPAMAVIGVKNDKLTGEVRVIARKDDRSKCAAHNGEHQCDCHYKRRESKAFFHEEYLLCICLMIVPQPAMRVNNRKQ